MKNEIIDRLEECRDYHTLNEIADILDCHYTMVVEAVEECRDDDKLERVLNILRYEG